MAIYVADDTFDKSLFAGSSCAFGVFDGLHTGHQYLIDQAVAARPAGARAVVLTFDIDPDEVFHPNRLKKLMRNADRLEALAASGVDDVVVIPFNERFYTKSPEEFLATAFSEGAPAHMHVGEDFRFGARAAGTVATLQEWGSQVGCQVHPHQLVSADGAPITATRIRKLLLSCQLDEANRLLGHPYALRETVQPGRGDGASFGFATANLQVKPHDRVLGEGVYAAYVTVGSECVAGGIGVDADAKEVGNASAGTSGAHEGASGEHAGTSGACGDGIGVARVGVDGERFKAAVSVGVSPTFEATSTANMEVHILDYAGELGGQDIVVQFVKYLRPMIKFDSVDELIATVMGNIQWVRDNL